jgi:aryl-alcohol dehydrogenase-like predicted oxidoreductase
MFARSTADMSRGGGRRARRHRLQDQPLSGRAGIGFVPYSPLGRGFLTGTIRSFDQLDADAWRRSNPRFEVRRHGPHQPVHARSEGSWLA